MGGDGRGGECWLSDAEGEDVAPAVFGDVLLGEETGGGIGGGGERCG